MKEDADLYDVMPEVEEELISALREHFRPVDLKPGDKLEDAMYSAGQQSVISWLQNARETQLARQNQII